MVVIGLLDLPPELQLKIAEFAETGRSLKALSVTSRSLRGIAQTVLFKKLRVNLGSEPRGSIDDLLANPRICAAIRFLELHRGDTFTGKPFSDKGNNISIATKLLPRMIRLKRVLIYNVQVDKVFLNAFLEVAAKIPLRVGLIGNTYPLDITPTPNTPLRISDLCFTADHNSIGFYQFLLRVSATTLTKLDVTVEGDELIKLADIDLPFLHDVTLSMRKENEAAKASIRAFITAHRTIRILSLPDNSGPLLTLPSDALPDLQELDAQTKLVNQLVPGRPVEAIVVTCYQRSDEDWIGEEVGRSTVRVRKLRVVHGTILSNTRVVKRMVTIFPYLERVQLSVDNDILLRVIEILTSLKCLTHLRITVTSERQMTCEDEDEVLENHDVNAIATTLRKANSCFSFIRIWDLTKAWKHTVSVWNELLGVFTPPGLYADCGW